MNPSDEGFMPSALDRATKVSELWHPHFVLFTLQTLVAFGAIFVSMRYPKTLIGIMCGSGLVFVISAVGDIPAWNLKPWSFLWTGVMIKWWIVNAGACVPVLVLHAYKPSIETTRKIGYFVYSILGSNIIWTLGMSMESEVVAYVNGATGVMLSIALLIHCMALRRWGQEFFEVRTHHRFPYGFGTTFPWLVCYTVWNALFTAKISIGTTLQDLLFWGMMFGYKAMDDVAQPIELYFGFARPVQLGTYIACSEWMGTFVPWFYNSPDLNLHQPLPINSNTYFFFIACGNLILSIVVTVRAAYRHKNGLGFFGKYILTVTTNEGTTRSTTVQYVEEIELEQELN